MSYRRGEPVPVGGRLLAIWRRPLAVEQAVPIDLEQTYRRAAADAYLD